MNPNNHSSLTFLVLNTPSNVFSNTGTGRALTKLAWLSLIVYCVQSWEHKIIINVLHKPQENHGRQKNCWKVGKSWLCQGHQFQQTYKKITLDISGAGMYLKDKFMSLWHVFKYLSHTDYRPFHRIFLDCAANGTFENDLIPHLMDSWTNGCLI